MDKNIFPCALLMNDVHVSKDNILEFEKNCDEALAICADRGIEEIVIGGDLWQSRAAQTLSTLMAVSRFLTKAYDSGVFVVIGEGNHCKVDQEAFEGYGHVFAPYPGVEVVDDWELLDYKGCDLIVMSYFPENGSFTEKLNALIASEDYREDRHKVLYIHEGINGALSTPAEKELPTHIFKPFDKVLVGHYHDRCAIPGTNIEYIGSSRQHNFGEDEEKGYTILYSDGSLEFVKNMVNKRYRTIELTAKQVNQNALKQIAEIKQDPLYLVKTKIECTAKEAELLDKTMLLESGVSKIDIVSKNTKTIAATASSFENKLDKAGIKKEYLAYCEDKRSEEHT